MKRFTAIVLLLSMALFAFPVFIPASAAETSGNYFNVLDYTGYDDGLSNTFDVEGSKTIGYNLSTYLGSFPVYGVELTYSYVGVQPTISSFMLNNTSFSVTSSVVSSGLVRVRGDLSGAVGESFTITFDASVTTVTIHSFNVYTVGVSDAPISGIMFGGNSQLSFDGVSSSTIYPEYGTTLQIRTDWWRNYDYADAYLTLEALGINSISAFLQETATGVKYNIPYELNYLNTFFDSTQTRPYDVQLRLDLSGLDHASIGDAILRIEFQLDYTSSSTFYCTMNSFRGFVFSDPVDADLKWNQILFNNLSNWFLAVYSAITNLDQNISSAISNFDQNVSSAISALDQTVTNFRNSLLQNLNVWIKTQTNSIVAAFDSLDRSITNLFDSWFTSLDGWLFDQTEAITSKLDELFGGEKFTDEEKDQLVSDLESVGDSVSSIGQSSQEIESMVKENFFLEIDVQGYPNLIKFMDLLWSQQYVFFLVLFTFFFALVGYVLFGKR